MISVIIVNFQSAAITKRAVTTVFGDNEEKEVIIVDNTATNEEKNTLKSILPDCVRLIFNERNVGFARACNQAFALSRGEFIFLLNPDAYVLPGALVRLKDFLIKHPEAGAVGPKIYWDNDCNFTLPPNYIPRPSHGLLFSRRCRIPLLTHFFALQWRWSALKVLNSNTPLEQEALSGGSVLIRRSAIEKTGGLFAEDFFLYFEDADFFFRLKRAGFKLYIDNSAGVVHNYNQSPEYTTSKAFHLARSHDIYMEKHFKSGYHIMSFLDMGKMLNNERRMSGLIDLRRVKSPLDREIPDALRESWLFEWSHNPNLFPAAVMQGKGDRFVFPENAWRLFKPGKYYGRISNAKSFFVRPPELSWEIC